MLDGNVNRLLWIIYEHLSRRGIVIDINNYYVIIHGIFKLATPNYIYIFFNLNNFNMKKIFKKQTYIFVATFILLSVMQIISFAQDSAASASTTTTTTQHTSTTIQPWVWVVGGAVLLLIIIALVRGGGSKGGSHTDKVTYTKTTSTDDN